MPLGFLISTIQTFGSIENKHNLYRGKHCTGKFCISQREHAANVINFEKKNILPVTETELKLHKTSVVFHSGSNCDYFIMKELVNNFEDQFKCLGENTEKYKTQKKISDRKRNQKS